MKITVKYNTAFVTSNYSVEELAKVQKMRPDAMKLMSEDGKEIICAIGVGPSDSFSEYGICFSGNTAVGTPKACIAVRLNGCTSEDDIKELIRKAFGMSIVYGSRIEQQIAGALEAISADEAEMDSRIEFDNTDDAGDIVA